MCNLYKMRRPADEIARIFAAEAAGRPNVGEDVYPGTPGLVVAEGRVRAMTWGLPLALTGRSGQRLKPRPVNNARADKLTTPFWRDSFRHRRCLIPVDAWAEAEGERGRMTRTWYALEAPGTFAVAGLWRATPEWGEAYAMVMVDGCPQMAEVHDRMPVILDRSDWQAWLEGPPDQALALCRTSLAPLRVERTTEPWAAVRDRPDRDRPDAMPKLL